METKTTLIHTDDGRALRIAEAGHPDGIPIVWHGGTPGSYVFPAWFIQDAEVNGIRWIGYNRPGYGDSTSLPGRDVASAASDVAAIAKHLGLRRLATFGASGGGPHALACAAVLPDLVVVAVAMASLAPLEANGLNWFAGMDEGNITEIQAAVTGRDALTSFIAPAASGISNSTVESMVEDFKLLARSTDYALVIEVAGRWFFDASREALRCGNEGWIDDDLAFCAPWGFDLAQIRIPVLIIHGLQDVLVPVAHGRWLADHIPGIEARFCDDEDHFTLFERQYPVAREWLVGKMK